MLVNLVLTQMHYLCTLSMAALRATQNVVAGHSLPIPGIVDYWVCFILQNN